MNKPIASAPRRAAVYVRQSLDRTGEGLAVSRQEALCRARARELGWVVANVYADNSVSASSANVVRPAYARMLADLDSGAANAVVVYDLDRLTRRPLELETFVELADRRGLALASVDREVDLATDGGRLFARIRGAVARAEVERKGRRQRDANDQRAAAGKPFVGRRAFGYAADSMTIIGEEAAVLRQIAERTLAGDGVRSICRDLSAAGVRSTAGNPIDPSGLRRMLSNPRYAGLRVHRGEVVGRGTWPAILDEETYRAVTAVLSDPSRFRAGAPVRHLLSGLARCAECGERLVGARQSRGGKPNVALLQCVSRQHVVRAAVPIEQLVVAVVLERLQRPDARDAFSAPVDRSRLAELRQREQGLRARLDGLAEAFAAGDVDRGQLRAGTARLRAELAAVTGEIDATARTPDLAGLLSAEDVAQTWQQLDLDRQRSVISSLVDVVVHPSGRGARRFDPETIRITWR